MNSNGDILSSEPTIVRPAATLATDACAAEHASPDTSTETKAGMRFRVLRSHALGGLGEVFIAHDAELNRQVALKRIRGDAVDTPTNRARFMLEAEVTGGLEHPGIVPVYSLGTSDDGRPFYAMRFIHGQSLRDAIKAFHTESSAEQGEGLRSLELRQLLTRFIDVCNAIEYAHSRGVLHRDIKPENIMLGRYGETLVVDWGLAKTMPSEASYKSEKLPESVKEQDGASMAPDGTAGGVSTSSPTIGNERRPAHTRGDAIQPSALNASAPTQTGATLGTPAYMSPEQAAGRLEQVGPATDVYGLGATLYCLLTGRPPFEEHNLGRLLERVRRGDFASPRQVNRQLSKALEAICLKAMAIEPAQRYPSPRALANDLERWLADERIGAFTPAWHERFAHWGRRHRRGVQSAVAALAIVAVVSTAAAFIVQSAKEQVENERDTTKSALQAEQQAQRKARLALDAEREAKDDARRTIDNYVTLVTDDDMLKDERVQPLRQRLLRDALTYYEGLIEKHGSEEHLRRDLASAILRVGRINQETGSKEDALRAFQQALDTLQQLVNQYPAEDKYLSDLAFAYRSAGTLENELSHPQEALENLRRAVEIQVALVGRAKNKVANYRELAVCYWQLAEQEVDLRHDDNALNHAKHALEIRRELAQMTPDDTDLFADMATSLQSLAVFHAKRERWKEARAYFEQALRIRGDLSRRRPDVERYQVDLATTINGLGVLDVQTDQFDRARRELVEALAVRQRLVDDHPSVTEYQQMLAITSKNLGYLQNRTKYFEEALDYFQRSIAVWRRLAAGNPAVDRFKIQVSDAYYDAGMTQLDLSRREDALQSFIQARDVKKRLVDAKPDNHAYHSALGAAEENVASTLHLLSRDGEARTAYLEAIAEQQRACETQPDNGAFKQLLAHHYLGLAEVERALGHSDAAEEAEARAAAKP